MSRTAHAEQLLGQSLFEKLQTCRVLVVGAGGIGCELLKNLVLSGFRHIELVDLDTIDLSNLNRQFLFRKHHIKKSKAHVARESALKFNPNVNIKSHHANIKDPEFNVEWFKSFDIVMNALDNLEARFHVNEMCMAANVPLLESGTEGYVGQVTVIKKDESECYACQEKPKKVTYPVCTIRSTPSKPIHCIVWAKSYLFSQLFGTPEDEEEEIKEDMDADNAQEIENLKQETQELIKIREAMGSDNYAFLVFKKVFNDDINRLLTWEDIWKKRTPPKPLVYETLENGVIDNGTGQYSSNSGTLEDQKIWSLKENFNVFVDSVRRLSKRLLEEKADDPTASLSFDKDDDDALDFVTATANLRSYIFDIKMNSKFDVKAMAGNIIPAIATTNAIIAGMIVMQGFKVLSGNLSQCKTVYFDGARRPQIFPSESLLKPNPSCAICRNTHVSLKINTKTTTLRAFLEKIVHSQDDQMDTEDDVVIANARSNEIIYDLDYMDSLDSTFEQLSLRDGSMLSVTADSATPAVFAISHSETFESPETWYEVDRDPADIFRRRMSASTENVSTPSHKRKHDNDDELDETSPHKRLYTEMDKVLVIKDDDLEILTEVPPGFGDGN